MARSFKDRYEELFGETPDYDPIKLGYDRSQKRALNIQASVPEIDASGGALDTYPEPPAKAISPDQGVMGNIVDLTKTGTAMLGEAVLGVGEYAARQATPEGPSVAREILTDVSSGLESVRGKLTAYRQSVYDLMPQDAIALKGAEFLTLDPDKTIWKGSALEVGEAILYKFWESVPMMVATIIPGAVMMRAGASAKAITYLGASEGGLSVGFIANDITDGIQEMDDETLAAESPRFVKLLETMDSPEAARDQLIAEAQGLAPLIGGILVGAISATAGRYLEPVITGKTAAGAATKFGVGRRAARGAVSEGLIQEGPQESIETITQNIAAAVYDGDRALIEGVAEAYVQGAVVGAPGGALVGAIGGTPGDEAPEGTPESLDRPGAPSSFRDVFGEQVPPPGGYTGAPLEQGDLFGVDPDLLVEEPLDDFEDARALQEGARQTRADKIRAQVIRGKKKAKARATKAKAGRLSGVLNEELVDPALAAAVSASIRGDDLMGDMMDNIATQDPTLTGRQDNLGGRLQGDLDLRGGEMTQYSDSTDFVMVPPQAEGFEEVMGPNVPGPQQPPVVPEMVQGAPFPTGEQGELFPTGEQGVAPSATAVAEAPPQPTAAERGITPTDGWVVTMTDDNGAVISEDIFATPQEAETVADQWHEQIPDAFINVTRSKGQRTQPGAAPIAQAVADEPTAEPLVDIQAQLEDMAHEATRREAVYLSAANVARIQQDNLADQIPDVGVKMPNFDGKGGMLIARDEEVAQGALEMIELGMPMETVLGQLTRAGAGKPMGDTVVQVRDDAGRVVRETLVASEDEAFALAEQLGDSAVVLTSAQALKRRETLIAEEQADIEASREAGRQQQIIREELPMEERGEVEKFAGEGVRKPATRAAAGTLGLGAKKADIEKGRAIGGFYPPDTLEFDNAQAEQDYREAFSELVDNQIAQEMAGTYPISLKSDLKKAEKKLFIQIGKIRQVAKPKRKVTRVLKVAAKIDRATVATQRKGMSIKPSQIDKSQEDYFAGEQFEQRTREQIDALEGTALATAFAEAAYWLAGQYRNVEIVPEFLGDNPDALDTDIADTINKAGGDPLPALAASYPSPGLQKKLIRRVNIYARRKEYGGKVAARGVTASAAGTRTTTTEYDTGVLTRKTEKQDESRADVLKREQRAKKSKADLTVAVGQSSKLIDRLENPNSKYSKLIGERDVDGNLTDGGQNMLSAMHYFIALTDFALSLIQSGQTTSESSRVMERLNTQLRALVKLAPDKFAKKVSQLARADEQASLKTIADPKVREQVTSPSIRESTMARYYDNFMASVARRLRMHKRWKKNAFYVNQVGPLMNKFAGAIASRIGWDYDSMPSWSEYRPTEAEMNYLQYAMRGWRKDPELKKTFYNPMKLFFEGVGVTFDTRGDVVVTTSEGGRKYTAKKEVGVGYGAVIVDEERVTEEGKYEWSPSEAALEAKVTALGQQVEGVQGLEISTESINRERLPAIIRGPSGEITKKVGLPAAEQRRVDSARRLDEREDDRQAAVLRNVNTAINALLRIVNNKKSTMTKLATAELNFIRKMKKLGVWADTKSPMIGRILVGTVKRYHKIAFRMLHKKITKQEARAIMGRLKPFPIPKGSEQRKFTISQAERELDLLFDIVGPERNAPELLRTAQQLGIKLGNRDIAPSMSAMLRTMLETLPENHVYRALAEKLLALNINDVGVQFDWGGKVLGKEMGRFRTRRDEGRNIYINRKMLREQRDFGGDMSVNVIHTMLHEMVHAATHRALSQNVGLNNTMLSLRQLVIDQWTGPLPYGLKEARNKQGEIISDEFVAEAFSNPEFQAQLKQIYLDGRTAWQRFVTMVRNVLGFDDTTPVSVMDVIMSVESQLFAGSDLQIKAEEAVDLNMDIALRPAMSKILDGLDQGVGSMKKVWSGIRPPLIAMTMEQMRDTYQQYFGGSQGPMRKYMNAFFARNAENTRLMERAEKMTRKWTALDEEHGAENGIEFSRIATEATMQGVAMAGITDPRNEHVTSPKKKATQQALYKRFKKLPPGYQKLYTEMQAYYRETLESEVDLLTHNALRGLLQKEMSVKAFEEKYSIEKLKAFDTPEKFKAEFKQYLDEDMISTLNQMTHVRQQRQGDYFPLKRYGDFVVYAEHEVERKVFSDSKKAYAYAAERRLDDITLDVSVKAQDNGSFRVKVMEKDFRMAETKTKAEQNRLEMVEQYGDAALVTPVQLKSTRSQDSAISSNSQLNSILESLDGNPAAQAAIKNFYLQALADSSFRKHEMKRKNRAGVETDIQLRNFTVYAKQSSYYTAQLMYGSKMAEGLAEMDRYIKSKTDESDITSVRLGQVLKELQQRDEMTVDINEIARYAKKSVEVTQFMMLTSPSYWMINASQPWMVTLPWLNSKYGLSASLSAMKQAQKLIAPDLFNAGIETKGGLTALWSKTKAEKAFNVLDDVLEGIKRRDPANYKQYAEMLGELKQQGVIDLSWIAELRDISEGTDTGQWQKTLDASRVMAHLTEVNNRILTALATYELAKQKAIDTKIDPATAHLVGIKEAKLAVSQTQFNYSSPNKPRLFQSGGPLGSAGPVVFQFMQWPQHMYALMIQNFSLMAGPDPVRRKEARKLLAGLFATHLAAGGILGAALQPVKWAFGLLAMVFGDEGEDTLKGAISGETFDRGTTKLLADMFGSEIAMVLTKGLPTIVGGDLSQRMSLGTVYYLNFRGNNAESALGSLVLGLGGASVNLVANFGRGVEHFFDGNYRRAIESASPKILRDIVRTTRYWDEGLVNRAGDTVIESEGISAWSLALQSMGVQPVVVSRFYAGQSAIKDKEIFFRERKSDILKDFRAAVGDPAAVASVLRNVAHFNRNNPAIGITRSALLQSVVGKAEREARYRRYGANIDERAAAIFAKEADPYR